jgi:PhoH-like ATPase
VKLVTFIGGAGTGKTLLALAAGLRKVFDEGVYNKIIIARSIMPLGRDIGFLPGTKEEKLRAWLAPFFDNLEYICDSPKNEGDSETKKWILESDKFQVEAITYMRGRSLANTYIIIDEAQNLTPHELKTIISRVGENTKIVVLGDPTQIDNPYLDLDSNGLVHMVGRMKRYDLFGSIFFRQTERSALAALAATVL